MHVNEKDLKLSDNYLKAVKESRIIFDKKESKVKQILSEYQEVKLFLSDYNNVRNLIKYESYFNYYSILLNFIEDNFNINSSRSSVRFLLLRKGYIYPFYFLPIIFAILLGVSLYFISGIPWLGFWATIFALLLLIFSFISVVGLFNPTKN